MLKDFMKRILFFVYGIVGLLLLLPLLSGHASAAGPAQIDFSLPNGAQPLGHVGAHIHLTGSGFIPSAKIDLFTTPNSDATKCASASLKNPAAAGLTAFATLPNIDADAQGGFQVDTTWPNSAAFATTNYYICAIAANSSAATATATPGSAGSAAISTKSFTVAQPLELAVSAASVQPGGQVTVNGSSWLPPQPLHVAIVGPDGSELVATTVQAGQIDPMSGNFSISLTIPQNATAQSYGVKVYAINEVTLAKALHNVVTVADNNATATAAATNNATPTATAQATATSTTTASSDNGNQSSGGGGGATPLIYGLGGLGAILIIIGITVYIVYSKQSKVQR